MRGRPPEHPLLGLAGGQLRAVASTGFGGAGYWSAILGYRTQIGDDVTVTTLRVEELPAGGIRWVVEVRVGGNSIEQPVDVSAPVVSQPVNVGVDVLNVVRWALRRTGEPTAALALDALAKRNEVLTIDWDASAQAG
ncbi:MAG: hypothetical protein QOJ29_764 [Thermoleophilaceae bacterium]|nr:hypothetical protein [Thermoleophilaceae bacterium]